MRRAKGITPGQFALAWLLNNRLVTSPIVGPRTLEQMQDYLGALRYRFTAEDEALVDRLVVTGHPSTPGYNDPAYPIEGRIPRSGSGVLGLRLPVRLYAAASCLQRSLADAVREGARPKGCDPCPWADRRG